jgi:hypothetical protein
MPSNCSKYEKKKNVMFKQQTGRQAGIINKLMLDAKPTKL